MNPPTRIILAVSIGLLSAIGCYWRLSQRSQLAADFTFPWRAAQILLEGQDPYTVIQPTGEYPFQTYFYYPLPSALAAMPFSWMPAYLAGAIFFGLSSALLAYAITIDGWKRMPIFFSAPYLVAAAVAQWSPLIVAASLLAWLGFLLVCKPNIGLAGFLYNPTKRGLLGMLVFLGLAFLIQPTWVVKWLKITSSLEGHPPPVLILPFGPILLLALFRWRKPGGRLLLALSIFPQLLFFYDQLLLWLIPASITSSLALTGLSWIAYFAWRSQGIEALSGKIIIQPTQYILLLIYLPALVMVLWPERWSIAKILMLSQRTALTHVSVNGSEHPHSKDDQDDHKDQE